MANDKFKRKELKYKITKEEYEKIKSIMSEHMEADEYGKSTILSLYYDTPNDLLIRRSIEHPDYKEKIRMRSYGLTQKDDPVFLELKKKYNGIVYKRRIKMTEKDAVALCENNYHEEMEEYTKNQIKKEIEYALSIYQDIGPRMLLSYEREAWYEKGNRDFRVTFDENILWRDEYLDLHTGVYGKNVIPEEEMIMEIKTGTSIPLWMTEILTNMKIYKTSFSKYGTAYMKKKTDERKEKIFELKANEFLKEKLGGLAYA